MSCCRQSPHMKDIPWFKIKTKWLFLMHISVWPTVVHLLTHAWHMHLLTKLLVVKTQESDHWLSNIRKSHTLYFEVWHWQLDFFLHLSALFMPFCNYTSLETLLFTQVMFDFDGNFNDVFYSDPLQNLFALWNSSARFIWWCYSKMLLSFCLLLRYFI